MGDMMRAQLHVSPLAMDTLIAFECLPRSGFDGVIFNFFSIDPDNTKGVQLLYNVIECQNHTQKELTSNPDFNTLVERAFNFIMSDLMFEEDNVDEE